MPEAPGAIFVLQRERKKQRERLKNLNTVVNPAVLPAEKSQQVNKEGVQGQPGLHGESEVSLSYMRLLKNVPKLRELEQTVYYYLFILRQGLSLNQKLANLTVFTSSAIGLQMCAATTGFYLGARDQTQIFKFTGQTLKKLSHLPASLLGVTSIIFSGIMP